MKGLDEDEEDDELFEVRQKIFGVTKKLKKK